MRRIAHFSLALSLLCLLSQAAVAADASKAPAKAETASAAAPKNATKLKVAPNETVLYVEEIHCAGCAKKLSSRLFRVKGVVKVRTDPKADLAVITPQTKKEVDAKAAWTAAQKAGFQPTKLVGPEGTFVADKKTKAPQKVKEKNSEEKSKSGAKQQS